MRTLYLVLAVSAPLIVCGCAGKKEEPPQSQGLEIQAPGVDVELDREHGLRVKAGKTEVTADEEKGVNVKAPGVEFDAEPEKAGEK